MFLLGNFKIFILTRNDLLTPYFTFLHHSYLMVW